MSDTGWERVFSDTTTDDEGHAVLGDKSKGCRHCGSVSRKVSENDRVVLYHPSTECCELAAQDQVRYRRGDLDRVRAALAEERERVSEKARELENTSAPADRARIERELRHMERGLDVRVHGHYRLLIAEYELELAHANEVLTKFREPASLGLKN